MKSIIEFLHALGHYNFLQSALMAAIMVGIMSGIIGSFIILRGMSLMGDAISHSVLPGVAVAYMLGVNLMIGATTFGVIAVLLIGFVASNSKLKNDTAIGIVFSAFFALGFILISMAESSTNLHHILFGNVLAIVIIFIFVLFKELQITSFDEVFAKSYGLNTSIIHYGLMIILTLVTVSALQTVGIILIVAMLITPAATAFLWTNRLVHMLFVSSGVGVLASIVGLYLSYTMNWASGPAIVLVAAIIFLVSFVVAPKQGILAKLGVKNVKKA